ncbi:putative signal transducing protein [Niabella insulamsoli]|uniref:putative signal transducing protein n=1 Tax=Niabella insulamsoli TaxID=3144874 RepID=UPI0031FCC482
MTFVVAAVFDNYIEAHLACGRLESEYINCWLKDENIVTIYPVLTNSVGGGIKLMVAATQIERARALLGEAQNE